MVKKRERNRIVYIPYYGNGVRTNNTNEYTFNMVKILKNKYSVTGSLAKPTELLKMLRTKAVFLNWVEATGLSRKMKIQLMLHKLFGAKLIWVFHDKYPHDVDKNSKMTRNMNWLAQYSSAIMLHSKNSRKYVPGSAQNKKKAVFVPHILYESHNETVSTDIIREKYQITEDNFVFTMFGIIRPYKNFERGIEAFQKLNLDNAKLLIVGSPFDLEYAKKIEHLCKEDENIILDMHYISDARLDAIIDISDVILVPYKNESSMNSGVMIQAFSRGTTVIVPDICMARDMAAYKFFYMYRESLDKVMLKAYKNGKVFNRSMGKKAKEYMYQNNNSDIVEMKIDTILK